MQFRNRPLTSRATLRQATTSITKWRLTRSRWSTSQPGWATQSLSRLTQLSLKWRPRSAPKCGKASSTEILTRGRNWTIRHRETFRTTLIQRSWRDCARPSTTCTWQTSLSTRTLWTVAESSPTLNSQAVEEPKKRHWAWYCKPTSARRTENDNKRKWIGDRWGDATLMIKLNFKPKRSRWDHSLDSSAKPSCRS